MKTHFQHLGVGDQTVCHPKVVLICTIGTNVHVALRYFETSNGGVMNIEPYRVQEYLDGRWHSLSRHQRVEHAICAFEARVQRAETCLGPRVPPRFISKWTNLYLPEPNYGYQTNADALVKHWIGQAA